MCSKCKFPKILDEFATRKSRGKLIFLAQCKECRRKNTIRETAKATHEKRRKKSDYSLRSYRQRAYGLSQADFDSMLLEQDFKCAACKTNIDNTCCVDHDHITGEIRDLLCHRCNIILGQVNESIEILHRLINYLERWKYSDEQKDESSDSDSDSTDSNVVPF